MEHPEKCVLCDQEEETVQHILTSCVFARQFWNQILTPLGFGNSVSGRRDNNFSNWWPKTSKRIPKEKKRKGYNTLIVLGAWLLWKHQNVAVFENASPNLSLLVKIFEEESHLWFLAGAKGLQDLGQARVGG
ncbi:hypothetical protein PR202_ga13064 [Eleusine coracana subsp. coracana]|uniref:Reverse transcriptase zinc-binding domain-containing protein n=1 Tax=Eleusine coracana subsp. coracana TaxID=191504 RepID=A0AAV5CDR3_ELECO|nr:hypothetical protein PR202_ga13064 [Eleusine coracana subsp. coracana]